MGKNLKSKIKDINAGVSKKDIARGILWIGLGLILTGCSPKKEVHKNIFTGRTEKRIILEDIYSKENKINFSDMYINEREKERYLEDQGKSIRNIFDEDIKYTHPYNLEKILDNTLGNGKNAIVQTYSSEYNSLDKKAALINSHIKNMDLLEKKFPGEFETIACKIRNKEDLKYLNETFGKGYEKLPSTQFYFGNQGKENHIMGIEGVPKNKKEMNKLLYGIKRILNSGFNFFRGEYKLDK